MLVKSFGHAEYSNSISEALILLSVKLLKLKSIENSKQPNMQTIENSSVSVGLTY